MAVSHTKRGSKPAATKSLTPTRLCGHPELHITQADKSKPAPAFMLGCVHNHSCPVCGFGMGIGGHSTWDCPDKLGVVTDLQPSDSPSAGAGQDKAQS